MHPALKASLGALVLLGLGAAFEKSERRPVILEAPRTDASFTVPALASHAPCPEGQLPDGPQCVTLPPPPEGAPSEPFLQVERAPRSEPVQWIPRLPERDEEPTAYRYPVSGLPLFHRGFTDPVPPEGPGLIELAAVVGAPIRALVLRDQEGPTRVLGMGRLWGNTLVTAHDVRSPEPRVVLLIHGFLDAFAPGINVGPVEDDTTLAFVGALGPKGHVSVYVEARWVRAEVTELPGELRRLREPSVSVPIDLRNVLPEVLLPEVGEPEPAQ